MQLPKLFRNEAHVYLAISVLPIVQLRLPVGTRLVLVLLPLWSNDLSWFKIRGRFLLTPVWAVGVGGGVIYQHKSERYTADHADGFF